MAAVLRSPVMTLFQVVELGILHLGRTNQVVLISLHIAYLSLIDLLIEEASLLEVDDLAGDQTAASSQTLSILSLNTGRLDTPIVELIGEVVELITIPSIREQVSLDTIQEGEVRSTGSA